MGSMGLELDLYGFWIYANEGQDSCLCFQPGLVSKELLDTIYGRSTAIGLRVKISQIDNSPFWQNIRIFVS